MNTIKKHWIFRVQDGENFENNPNIHFWGVKSGRNDCIKTTVKKIKEKDVLWFMTSKKYGGKIIGMAEYTNYYDKRDEPLINVNTYSNKEQNWKGENVWDIQVHYTNLYITERQNISAIIQWLSHIQI